MKGTAINYATQPEFCTFFINIARAMLHYYDFQDALNLDNGGIKIFFIGEQIQGTKYRFKFDKHYLRGHGQFFYSHSVIISLVTALETYFETKIQVLQGKISKDEITQRLVDEYLKGKRYQQLDSVVKTFNIFHIDIYRDVDKNIIEELFNRRHIIVHTGGLMKDERTRKQFKAANTPVGGYAIVRGVTLEKYIDTVVKMVSSIEEQSNSSMQCV